MSQRSRKNSDCQTPDCCHGLSRRRFLATSGAAAAALPIIAGPFTRSSFAADLQATHLVPVDKKLTPEWIQSLTARGETTLWSGDRLTILGMPVGGVGAGQMYVTGDGTLACWHIYNHTAPLGRNNQGYQASQLPGIRLQQGYAVRIKPKGGKPITKRLDKSGFPNVAFIGQYPISQVLYRDETLPVQIQMAAFSPFIPLNAKDSALPATIMEFTLKNTSTGPVDVALAGWLENPVGVATARANGNGRRQQAVEQMDVRTDLAFSGLPSEKQEAVAPKEPEVFADFEGNGYNDWTVNGEAFGSRPARGTLEGQQDVSGFQGRGLVNTYNNGDRTTGKLLSPEFELRRPFINFLVGGGGNEKQVYIRLLVGGKEVARATGREDEHLAWRSWNVKKHLGKKARIEIVDDAMGAWGHINVDQIVFADAPARGAGDFEKQNDYGTVRFSLLEGADAASVDVGESVAEPQLSGRGGVFGKGRQEIVYDLPEVKCASLCKSLTLAPGEEKALRFVLAWHFPTRRWAFPDYADVGNYYTNLFRDAEAVVQYIAGNYERLAGQTRLYVKTYYDDSTLPHWLLERIGQTPSILATGTVHWRKNGRFWGWEGVGCCAGTCGHVWNYEHAMARLFPELERSVREMQDYDAGYSGNGFVSFRAESFIVPTYAADAQPGYVLKSYREHLCSKDGEFLKRNYARIKSILKYSMLRDGNFDGLVEDEQHNTYDINFFGVNPMTGSLYLAALLAGEKMAQAMGDAEFAAQCRKIFESGTKLGVERMWDGEYFTQPETPESRGKEFQYIHACLSDQLFGQGWSRQLGLADVYPKEKVLGALQNIWKYNWAPDVGPHAHQNDPGRWFAREGDAGLLTATWPKTARPGRRYEVLYRNEVWTGIEYQVAGNMIYEGLVEEGLSIIKGIHDRHDGRKHNPFNEVECGDHYSRAMAGWGCLLAACGFYYHGPSGVIGFAPRVQEKDFACFFSGAEGWGLYTQKDEGGKRKITIEVRYGTLPLSELRLDGKGVGTAGITAGINGQVGQVNAVEKDGMIVLTGQGVVPFKAGDRIEITLPLA